MLERAQSAGSWFWNDLRSVTGRAWLARLGTVGPLIVTVGVRDRSTRHLNVRAKCPHDSGHFAPRRSREQRRPSGEHHQPAEKPSIQKSPHRTMQASTRARAAATVKRSNRQRSSMTRRPPPPASPAHRRGLSQSWVVDPPGADQDLIGTANTPNRAGPRRGTPSTREDGCRRPRSWNAGLERRRARIAGEASRLNGRRRVRRSTSAQRPVVATASSTLSSQ